MKLKLSQLKPNDNNPRFISDTAMESLIKSIKDFPEMLDVRPVVVNKEYVVLGGNMRFRAMKALGYKEIEVTVVDWPEDKQQEFIIKDNVSGGEWDWDILANEWDTALLTSWGLDLPNYHSVNDVDPENFEEFNEIINDENFYHLNVSFRTEDEYNKFLRSNAIILDNNYKRVGKVVSIIYPQEERKDIKNVRYE